MYGKKKAKVIITHKYVNKRRSKEKERIMNIIIKHPADAIKLAIE